MSSQNRNRNRNRNPAKRIPKSLGTETKLFGRYTLTDVAVVLLPGVLVVLGAQMLVPADIRVSGYDVHGFVLPLAGVGILFGGLFVYLTPTYTTSAQWLGAFLGYHRSEKEIAHEEARAHTQIEAVHPERGVIERRDGAFLGFVQVEPPTMALATDRKWRRTAASFEDFLNTAVEFPIQIFSTTKAFEADAYLASYTDRLSDPDVKENPHLAALIENYVEWYTSDLDDRRMTIRDHYVIVPVEPAEVQFERASLTQKFARLPILGGLVRVWFKATLEEEQAAMAGALEERLRRIETGLREIEGCTTRRVEVTEATRLVAEYWAGESLEYGDLQQALRTGPLVGGRR